MERKKLTKRGEKIKIVCCEHVKLDRVGSM